MTMVLTLINDINKKLIQSTVKTKLLNIKDKLQISDDQHIYTADGQDGRGYGVSLIFPSEESAQFKKNFVHC